MSDLTKNPPNEQALPEFDGYVDIVIACRHEQDALAIGDEDRAKGFVYIANCLADRLLWADQEPDR